MLNKITGLATAVALLFAGSSATAATYVANRAVGTGSVNLSITTDDTLGVLSGVNILDWTILADTGINVIEFRGPVGNPGNSVSFTGNALTATATDILFNFDAPGRSYVFFFNGVGNTLADFGWIGAESAPFQNGPSGPSEFIYSFGGPVVSQSQAYSGNQIVASVANVGPGPVPEPATWAMMIMGFGAAGSLLRRRRIIAA